MPRWALVLLLISVGCRLDQSSVGEGSAANSIGETGTTAGSDATGSTSTSTTASAGDATESLDDGASTTTGDDTTTTGPPPPSGLLAHFDTFVASSEKGVQMVEGVGFEPRAVLLWITPHTEDGVIDVGYFGRGWTDGIQSGAVATAWERDGNGVSSRWTDAACVTLVDEDGETISEGSGAGMQADGFSIDWTIPGDGRRVAFLALGGDIEARVGNRILTTDTETVDDVGFPPDMVLLAGVQGMVSPSTNNRGGHGFGGAVASPITMHSSAHREGTNGNGSSGLVESSALFTADQNPSVDHAYEMTGVDFTGFGLSRQDGMSTIGTTWLALRGVMADGGVLLQPNVGGPQPVDLDFEPVVVMFDGGDKVTEIGSEPELVHGVAVGPDSQGALWMGRAGGATQSAWDLEQVLLSRTADALLAAEASVSAMDAGGFTLEWSAVDGGARRIGWFALGSAAR